MYKFTIIPFVYFFKTRLKSRVQKLSWLFVYFLPNIFLYFSITGFAFNAENILLMTLGIVLINYIYENGYIQNDIILTQNEKNPNLRIKGKLLIDIREKIKLIFFYRFLIIFLLLFLIYMIDSYAFDKFIIVTILLQILYIIYNSIRSNLNLYLILLLSFLRFYGFIIPFVELENLVTFSIFCILLYPFSKFLEFTKQPKYKMPRFSKLIGKIDEFRIVYYFILVSFFLLLHYLDAANVEYVYISFFYLLFRILVLLLFNTNPKIKKEILNNTKKLYRE